MAPDVRARFDRYDPELLEGHDLARRAEKAGRSIAEQCGYEDGYADGIAEATRRNIVTELNEVSRLLYGPGPYTRNDPFGEPQPVDPADEDKWL